MNFFHFSVAVINISCGLIALYGIYMDEKSLSQIVEAAIFLGYFANLIAIIVCFVILVGVTIRAFKHAYRPYLKNNWLGIFNGLFVVVFWGMYFGISD